MDMVAVLHYAVSYYLYLRLNLGFVNADRKSFVHETPFCQLVVILQVFMMVLIWLILIELLNTTRQLVRNSYSENIDGMSCLSPIMACAFVTILGLKTMSTTTTATN